MQKDLEEIIELAQAGNEIAKNALVKLMMDNGYMKQLNRYLYRNRLLNPNDVQSDFWIGVIKSLPRVKPNIGDPLQYLTWKGLCNVRSSLRSTIQRNVFYICNTCGRTGKVQHHSRKCPQCNSIDIDTMQYEINIQEQYMTEPVINNMEEITDINDRIERFKEVLTGRECDVFTLIVQRGYNKDACINYLKEVSVILGISAQCVNMYLKKIRSKYREFNNDKGV